MIKCTAHKGCRFYFQKIWLTLPKAICILHFLSLSYNNSSPDNWESFDIVFTPYSARFQFIFNSIRSCFRRESNHLSGDQYNWFSVDSIPFNSFRIMPVYHDDMIIYISLSLSTCLFYGCPFPLPFDCLLLFHSISYLSRSLFSFSIFILSREGCSENI